MQQMKNGELESDVIVEENSIENAMVASSIADLVDTERNRVESLHSQHLAS